MFVIGARRGRARHGGAPVDHGPGGGVRAARFAPPSHRIVKQLKCQVIFVKITQILRIINRTPFHGITAGFPSSAF